MRVLDLSRLLPGPFATMILADMGASVDKVEDPRGGDYMRFMPPKGPDGLNPVFGMLNRGKRSVVLDLKQEGGRDALKKLVAQADVLVESFRPGVLDRLGLGYDELKAINPRLIVCAITGYGQDGPLKDRAGHDLNYLARAGVMGRSISPTLSTSAFQSSIRQPANWKPSSSFQMPRPALAGGQMARCCL